MSCAKSKGDAIGSFGPGPFLIVDDSRRLRLADKVIKLRHASEKWGTRRAERVVLKWGQVVGSRTEA